MKDIRPIDNRICTTTSIQPLTVAEHHRRMTELCDCIFPSNRRLYERALHNNGGDSDIKMFLAARIEKELK